MEDENPFADIVAKISQPQGGAPQSQPQTSPQGMMGGNGGGKMGAGMMPEPLTQPGVGNGTTQALLGALQQLNNFIKSSQDKTDIATAQSIIAMISNLIQRDQTAQNQINKA